ncbi:undecaprenyldiphospho-muramoylpentapeptide beta-N-acetylglucosaminyltransferase [Sporanaerobium hydrogeniformans]|uniref:Undecaprenyldiphospho-muramoylpentapeptide beta-N-acetylglucosaminyltransferase n=1 Tax=Sporanaerobium hydrogeniformans TaxID=3072179 RepID=A0AC61DBV2_9FIRM|nr:undecaprenyldiphospho-muramoylpentapeptide beta-N-acetylglucosaminyltransferase [Sporanaerobium hydrogeniformans]PHV70042.1 undecaprenyldiphospho-muramoylpentapeptide beta-N-acetylglucosaminyltransferase [Sporanaerobium hydrogeniformans]
MKTIVLTGGGTAGHVTPNIALLPKLKEEGWDIRYVGSHTGIEKQLITKENIPYYGIASGKLRRYISLENFKDPFKVIKGYLDAYKILKRLKPQIVFSKGGYVTVPVVLAANTLRIPVVIHESDITPGLANKIAIKGAKKVCVNFEETLQYVGRKGVYTGSPIREELFKGNKEEARKLCGFKESKPTLLMMGGSLGARKLNKVLREALGELLPHYNIVHICGRGNYDTKLEGREGYKQFEYVDKELPHLFALADVMLSRAGANSLAEIVALHIPSLLIPLSQKASRGDQILNAYSMKKKGYAACLEEEELTSSKLVQEIEKLYSERKNYITAMEQATKVKSIDKVLQVIKENC